MLLSGLSNRLFMEEWVFQHSLEQGWWEEPSFCLHQKASHNILLTFSWDKQEAWLKQQGVMVSKDRRLTGLCGMC